MKLIIRIVSFVATFAVPVLATTPKPAPATLPPLQVAPPPGPIAALPVGPPVLSWTRQMIENLGISTTMKLDFLLHIKTTDQALNTSTQSTAHLGASEQTRHNLLPHSEHWIAPSTSVQGTGRGTADGFVNFEPSVITNRFNTTDRTTIAFTKFDAANTPLHYWTSTTDYVNFTGYPNGVQFELPVGTTRANDPLLSENAYNSNIQPNAFPKRTY